MRKKSTISLLLSLTILSTMLQGCSSSSTTTTAAAVTSSEKTENTETTKLEENKPEYPETGTYPIPGADGITLTYWRPWTSGISQYFNDYGETPVYQAIAERTGVNIEFIHPTIGEEKNQFNLMVASGQFPDIMTQGNMSVLEYYPGGPVASVEDGLCIDLTPYLQEYAPDFYNVITSNESLYRDITDNDGKISAFTTIKDLTPSWVRPVIRTEDLDKYADGKIPETLDEYEVIFEKMKADGKTGIIIEANGYNSLLMQSFDVAQGLHLDSNGQVVFGQTQSGFKQYLELLRNWYEKGYLYKDFMTLTKVGDRDTVFYEGDVCFYIRAVGVIYSNSLTNDYKWNALPFPRVEKGQSLHMDAPASTLLENAPTSVSTTCKYPEIAIQYLNYLYCEEGAELANWGVPEAWDEVNGERIYNDYMMKNEDYGIATTRMILRLHTGIPKLGEADVICDPETIKDETVLAYRNMYSDDTTIDCSMVLPNIRLTPEENAERAKILTDINTYTDEMVLKFITGAVPMSDWDSYVAQIESMNVARAVELTQTAYENYLTKPLPLLD